MWTWVYIHQAFATHEHTDHILGIVWMVRMIATAMKKGKYEGELRIYCHPGLADTISTLCRLTLQGKFYKMIGEQIFLIPVEDGETVSILDYDVTFFDILSTKVKQFGFYHAPEKRCSSPAAETSSIRNVSHMWKAVSGFFTKHSASMVTENGSSLMKNITAQ